ncbi:alpha/beta hydrolase [Flavobacterium cheniae]|uniref:Pimeloyl-ACP methyl ester carboxylesterase n=1 Tax=Flavobacterium cheniae TaxID=295428 RepID=A0A562KSQ0_9FLAO|nr:alpha/beta hydrolase [Flavobacterium cheniae]TDR25365.1 pimeloyl-ACP methyl ester carboxylesterase [Flavobacterium cheniae]TWH98448.1 pimeloyl-ACP methyl ester carboxylesterase [Flavobacterium cheniae]
MPKKKQKQAQVIEIPKAILLTAKFLQAVSPSLTTKFAAKLFTTPIRHKLPKRELHMERDSIQKSIVIPEIQKEIVVYEYGKSDKKVLLVHGWSGRGTQLVKIADELLKMGYMTISFDAPAHGKSKGNSSIMIEFIASILEIEKQYGPFEFAIGHSLGGMSVLNAIKQNLQVKKAVIIGSGDIIQDIIDDFICKLQLKPEFGIKLRDHFEAKFGGKMDDYSAYKAAEKTEVPVFVIHDKDDDDVSVKAAYNIQKHLKQSEIMITEGLGHRKILGDENVIQKVKEFITK